MRIRATFLGAEARGDVLGKVAARGDSGVEDTVGAKAGRSAFSEEGARTREGCAPGPVDASSGESVGTTAGPESPSADDPTSRRRRLALTLSGSSSDPSPKIAVEATSCACL